MKMKKIACLVAAMVMTFGITTTVMADTVTTSSGVTYDGSKISNDTADLSQTLSGIMPGDTAQITVDLKNTGKNDAMYYMSAGILKSFEETQGKSASGAAYNVSLYYQGSDGATTYLYGNADNSFIVGSPENEAAVGLKQLTANDMIYLGNLANGQSGKVVMVITLDGSATDNSYMTTLADLQMQFGVEDAPRDEVVNRYTPGQVITVKGKDKVITIFDQSVPLAPKTGDVLTPLVISLAALAVGAGLMIWAVVTMKKQKNEEVQ